MRKDVLYLLRTAAVASRVAFGQNPTPKNAWRVVNAYGWYLWKFFVYFPERRMP